MKKENIIIGSVVLGAVAVIGLIALAVVVTAMVTANVVKEEKALKGKDKEVLQPLAPVQRTQAEAVKKSHER